MEDIFAEAISLSWNDRQQASGYSGKDIYSAAESAGIPIEYVRQAIENIELRRVQAEENRAQAKQHSQNLLKQTRVLMLQSCSWLAVPIIVGSSMALLRHQITPLVTDVVIRFNKHEKSLKSENSQLQNEVVDLQLKNVDLSSTNESLSASLKLEQSAQQDLNKLISGPDFNRKVIGKNIKEVFKIVGKPDSIKEREKSQSWYYSERVRQLITNKVGNAMLTFDNNIVTDVSFSGY